MTPRVCRLSLAGLSALVFLLLVSHGLYAFSMTGLFYYIGQDYRAFRATAEVARRDGFSKAYDLERLEPYQREMLQDHTRQELEGAAPIPTPYLPVFVLPFLALLAFPPLQGWWVMAAANAIGIGAYMVRVRSVFGPGRGLYWLPLLALPTYLTILFGQVNLLLLIGFGEFLLALNRDRQVRAGLWLSLLLVKPQSLVLILPGMALSGRFRVLLGLAVAGAVLALLSFALAGPGGMLGLAQLLLLYPGDLPTTYPESMMTWRAILAAFTGSLPTPAPTLLAASASVLTAIPGIWVWRLQRGQPNGVALAALGSYAATCAVAWHAHVHMALPLLVPLLWLAVGADGMRGPLVAWVLIPSGLFSILAIRLGLWEGHVIAGWTMFGLNIILLMWSYLRLRRLPAPQGSLAGDSP